MSAGTHDRRARQHRSTTRAAARRWSSASHDFDDDHRDGLRDRRAADAAAAWYIAFARLAAADRRAVRDARLPVRCTGIGVWGLNIPVGWAFDITNFVFWVGIGHAGTLISAILFLFRQKWRTAINRFAEAMTIFAVICAGIFPAIHVGRPWLAYWLFPLPEPDGDVAELPQPAAVGRVRGQHLLHGLAAVLVHGHDPRPGDAARPRHDQAARRSSTACFALGWRGSQPPLAPLRAGLPAAGGAGDAAGALACTRS